MPGVILVNVIICASRGGRGIHSLEGPLGSAKAGGVPPILLYLFSGVKW